MIEDILAQAGLVPDIDDDQLGQAYESCPAVHKSVVKNAVSFAHALTQTGSEPLSLTRMLGHVEESVSVRRLDWAFFCVDLIRFPVTAICAAMTQALAARVETVVVHVTGPLPDVFLFGCDLLSVDQIFTGPVGAVLDVLAANGQGVVIDLAGLNPDFAHVVRPDPAGYGVRVELPDSEFVQAYHAVTALVQPQARPYISYGGDPGSVPVVMAGHLLGCWVWDVITPATFRRTTATYS